MISATEARKKINDLNTKKGQQEKELCEKRINQAIENGRTSCAVDSISEPTKKWLTNLGYSVRNAGDQRDGFYTEISW